MIICEDEYPEILNEICKQLTQSDIELVFVENIQMQEINRSWRGFDKTTDVLSFPLVPQPHSPIGSIVINIELAKQKAVELGHSQNDEIALLFIHGLLHILGFDHEIDSGEMRQKEIEIIKNFSLPDSLIVRTENTIE